MNKYDLHIHTSECDKYAQMSGAEIVRLYSDRGYSGIIITDHYFSMFFEWFADELTPNDQKSIIDRYLRGYYSARDEGEKRNFKVLCGAEVRFDGTINDYLVYGLEEEDLYRLPILNRLHSLEELRYVLPDHAMIVQAHPFRDKMTVHSPDILSGIEVYNGGTEKIRNDMAKMFASHYGKITTSGSDFHAAYQLARGGIATDACINSAKDLCRVLKSGNFELIENYDC